MVKRLGRQGARERKASEDMNDEDPPPSKKQRYNLRKRSPKNYKTEWIDDDTLEDDEEIEFVIELEQEDEILELLQSHFSHGVPSKKREKKTPEKVPIELSRSEKAYYDSLAPAQKKEMLTTMNRISVIENEGEVPYKFKILGMPISDYMKAMVLKKLDALSEMNMDSGGAYKLKTWVDGFLRVPFGKTVPLPVKLEDGLVKCTNFMVNARKQMDEHIYGMKEAKTQIMQVVSQWIVNPGAVGNVIALQGPMGVGKTSFARNGIASVLQRPFGFFTLGGASDISNFVGHSYTYEGSTWGRIADTVMQCGVMNPVLYFDELDKVSSTPHGEEIISMLIHLTDRSQNKDFHDRYFAGVNFDMSQCLFVFSFNDIEKVHPILRDRMSVIECGGYGEKDKGEILKNYIWPEVLERLRFKNSDVCLDDEAIKYVIQEYSEKEAGVRNLIRTIETVMTRLNMLRVANDESMKDYPFYMEVSFPFRITSNVIKTLMKDKQKTKQDDTWRMMYT